MGEFNSHRLLKYLLSLVSEESELVHVADAAVGGIVHDSRLVQKGDIFVALVGEQTDGHQYIPQAIERGALAVVGTRDQTGLPVPYIRVENSRSALAVLAAGFYNFPARHMTMIGVTGTDGKTTTCNIIYSILRAAGISAGMISTVNAVIGDQRLDTGFHVTTPEAQEIQSYLSQMLAASASHVILEATSHGLAQQRVDQCEFDIGAVTNITHEHLDYHRNYSSYRAAKGSLFSSLTKSAQKSFSPPRAAVLNLDDTSYAYLSNIALLNQISYGLNPSADIHVKEVEYFPTGMVFTVTGRDIYGHPIELPVKSPLVGEFNLLNSLAAITVTLGVMNIALEAVQVGIAHMQGVPGRMERIILAEAAPAVQDITAIVDFAHTPNALQRALETARQLTQAKVIAVIGSAGLRDRMKRRMMALVAAQFADLTILTAEDPRTESLEEILLDMAGGFQEEGGVEGRDFWRVADRGEAIKFAVQIAGPGDLVIACGKGHEQSMCFGAVEYPWDDRQAMRAALAERYGIPGYRMPYLPTQPK
jgi:UDP-N-acetylmuramoyl-L-alanyl-D-glutamate--2,6-diaminopimelate ligase